MSHLSEQLAHSIDRIKVQTRHGVLTGARATNGAIAFLGSLVCQCQGLPFALEAPIIRQLAFRISFDLIFDLIFVHWLFFVLCFMGCWLTTLILEVPYALPPRRFDDPVPLPHDFVYEDREYICESTCAR